MCSTLGCRTMVPGAWMQFCVWWIVDATVCIVECGCLDDRRGVAGVYVRCMVPLGVTGSPLGTIGHHWA